MIFKPLISATNKLIGRSTAGTGLVEEISLGNNLSYTNSTLNAAYYLKQPVEAASTAALTVTSSGTGVGQTLTNAGAQAALVLDGVTMVVGERVLIKDQATASQNGIFTVTDVGSGASNWVLTRATDADGSDAGVVTEGMQTMALRGTVNVAVIWIQTTANPITVGVTSLAFSGNSATSGGSISGSGAADRIAYWSGTTALTSSTNLAYNGTRLTLLATTEPLRVGYDASNYTNVTVGSAATVTTNIVGTTPTLITQFAGTEVGYWRPSSTQFYLGTSGSGNSGTAMTVVGQSNTIHATKNSINVFGNSNTCNMASSVVVGRNNTMNDTSGTGDGSAIFGSGNTMGYQRGICVGRDNTATGSGVVVLGYGCSATGNNAMTLGLNCTNTVSNTIKIGLDANNSIGFTNTGVFTTVAGGTTQFTISAAGVATLKGLTIAGTSAATLGSFNQVSTGTSITTPFPAFELINSDATTNNFVTFSFADAVSGASYGLIGGRCTDHTNNYGDLHFWTRGSSGGSTKMTIGANGGIVVSMPTDISLSGFTCDTPTTATTIGGTYAALSLVNSNTTNNNYSRMDFLDVANGTSSAVIVCRFVNHTTKEGNLSFHVNNGSTRIERIDMYTLETVVNESGGNIDFRVEGDTDANALMVDASADTVQVGSATTSDSAKFYVLGKISTSGEMEINGALNHDGSTVGLYNVTPVSRATTGITAGAFVANTAGTLNDSATYDGYTIGQIAAALRAVGILT